MYPTNQQYGGFQTQQQLPFRPDSLQWQMYNIDPGNPPFVPQIQVPPHIAPYAPLIAGLVMTEIQGRAANQQSRNPLRIFMFNQYAANNWATPEFAGIVEMIAMYAHIRLSTGGGGSDVIALLQRLVPEIVTMAAGAQISVYPGLVQYLDQNQANLSQQAANAFAAAVREIQQYVASQQGGYPQQQQRPQPMGGYQGHVPSQFGAQQNYAGSQMNPGLGSTSAIFGAAQPTPQTPTLGATAQFGDTKYDRQLRRMRGEQAQEQPQQPIQQNPHQHAPSYNSSLADQMGASSAETLRQPFQSRDPAVMSEVSSSNWNKPAAQPTFDQAAQSMNPTVAQPVATPAPEHEYAHNDKTQTSTRLYTKKELLDERGLKWKRSDLQPYRPFHHPRSHKCRYVVENNVVIAVILEREQGEPIMDFEEHAIGYVPTSPSTVPGRQPSIVDDQVTTTKDPVVEEIAVIDANTITQENTLESAFITAHAGAVVSGQVTSPTTAVRRRFNIVEPLVVETKEIGARYRKVLDEINKCGSFSAARDIMSELTADDDLLLRTTVNSRLTKALQEKLKTELGMAITTTDFYTDSEGIDSFIRTNASDTLANALKDKEAVILAETIGTLDEESSREQAANLIESVDGGENWTGDVVLLNTWVSITNMGATAAELNVVDAVKEESVLVTQTQSPQLSKMLTSIFAGRDVRELRFRYHYVVTRDGFVFEVCRGYLSKDAVLIKLVS